MKMFIPEIGSRLTLSEDWLVITNDIDCNSREILESEGLLSESKREDGARLHYTFTLLKGITVSVKQVKLKRGKSISNGVEFYIPKTKQPDKRFATCKFTVLLPDLEDLEFELEEKNEDTFEFVMGFLKIMREEYGGSSNIYREIERILLNHKTMLSFSPQQTISNYYKSALNRFDKYNYNGYKYKEETSVVYNKFKSYNRKYKITKVLKA